MIINQNTTIEEVQEKTKNIFYKICSNEKECKEENTTDGTLRELMLDFMRLGTKHTSFSEYDFIRLFIAYVRKNNEIFLDKESLVYDLYPFILGGYEILFQDIAVKEQIEGNFLEIEEALQKASLGGLITARACAPNNRKRLILITEEESNSIIEKYEESYRLKMENLVTEYLQHRQIRKMIAQDFREDEMEMGGKEETPIRTLKLDSAQRREHMRKMIRKDIEEDE